MSRIARPNPVQEFEYLANCGLLVWKRILTRSSGATVVLACREEDRISHDVLLWALLGNGSRSRVWSTYSASRNTAGDEGPRHVVQAVFMRLWLMHVALRSVLGRGRGYRLVRLLLGGAIPSGARDDLARLPDGAVHSSDDTVCAPLARSRRVCRGGCGGDVWHRGDMIRERRWHSFATDLICFAHLGGSVVFFWSRGRGCLSRYYSFPLTLYNSRNIVCLLERWTYGGGCRYRNSSNQEKKKERVNIHSRLNAKD